MNIVPNNNSNEQQWVIPSVRNITKAFLNTRLHSTTSSLSIRAYLHQSMGSSLHQTDPRVSFSRIRAAGKRFYWAACCPFSSYRYTNNITLSTLAAIINLTVSVRVSHNGLLPYLRNKYNSNEHCSFTLTCITVDP